MNRWKCSVIHQLNIRNKNRNDFMHYLLDMPYRYVINTHITNQEGGDVSPGFALDALTLVLLDRHL